MSQPSPPIELGSHRKLRVVLAEDDPEMRRIVAEGLRRDGHQVAELEHGGQVLQILALQPSGVHPDVADILVTDVRMPCVDGLMLVRALRALGWSRPAVMMTAFGDEKTHAEAADLGALILDKPFQLHDLRQLVIYAGRMAGAARDSRPPSIGPRSARAR
jgi:DNA-binding response OmpR family regulator